MRLSISVYLFRVSIVIFFPWVNPLYFPLAYDILKRMLEKDPRLRISAQEALRHPYFENQHVKQ